MGVDWLLISGLLLCLLSYMADLLSSERRRHPDGVLLALVADAAVNVDAADPPPLLGADALASQLSPVDRL
jgi:hypothetical protein